MQFVYDQIQNDMPPLRGVVHAAGAIRDAVLINQRWEDAAEIFGGKVAGAWLLHELTRELPLEFFILYSSAAVVLGAAGQGLYSAANAELDALAHFRRRLGLPALSVAWGPWAGAGMAADLAARGRDVWQARGLGKIEPAKGFANWSVSSLTRSPMRRLFQLIGLAFLPNYRRMRSAISSALSLCACNCNDAGSNRSRAGSSNASRFCRLASAGPALTTYLTERALQALGLEATTPIELRVPLKEFGLDFADGRGAAQ